jgi:hypothetical protein
MKEHSVHISILVNSLTRYTALGAVIMNSCLGPGFVMAVTHQVTFDQSRMKGIRHVMEHPRLNILIVSNYVKFRSSASVIGDYLFSFKRYSSHRCFYILNCAHVNHRTDFSKFDVIVLFWDIILLSGTLSASAIRAIHDTDALKVLFLQDEHQSVRQINQLMAQLGINIMCTCVAESDHRMFYPPSEIPSLQATYSVLPGYVPEHIGQQSPDWGTPRPLDIVYRARNVPYWLGDLGQEKANIAKAFQEIAATHGLRSDISTEESKRLYGTAWLRFLRLAKFTLGTGSGASVIDFTGEIQRQSEAYRRDHPEATYEEVRQRYFADVDGKVVINTVSSRLFEAAACGCTQILHKGDYRGILQANKHFISVNPDYSNLAEVLTKMKDISFCRELARNAYVDLIASNNYSYRTFVAWFDNMLESHRQPKTPRPMIAKTAFYLRHFVIPWRGRLLTASWYDLVSLAYLLYKRFQVFLPDGVQRWLKAKFRQFVS